METKFNFNSAICTNRVQSERLLALGLKKETADCRHWAYTKDSKGNPIPKRNQRWFTRICTDESAQVCGFMATTFLPAWSLHRLIEMMPNCINEQGWLSVGHCGLHYSRGYGVADNGLYNSVVRMYEWLIKEGYFNKEYLV